MPTFATARPRAWILLLAPLALPIPSAAQQVGDTAFVPVVQSPTFAPGAGPRVVVDEAHVNFHTVAGRFGGFARLLDADGFRVESGTTPFSLESLAGVDLLVISNALHPRNETDWSLPTPSAFTDDEIEAVHDWVAAGGALLLIADHMPFPGAAQALAERFGFEVSNGFAREGEVRAPMVFRRSEGSLGDHEVTSGAAGPAIDSVASFTGQAFRVPDGAIPLLLLRPGVVSLEPQVAWEFGPDTPTVDVGGWSQGAVVEIGRGRMAFFGEAAMFTAQRQGEGNAMGMNAPVAAQNPAFVLNLVHWLTRVPAPD